MAAVLLQAHGLSRFQLNTNLGSKPALPKGVGGSQILPQSARFHFFTMTFPERRLLPPSRIHASSGRDTVVASNGATGGDLASNSEDVVIVGGGIAGAATALALHRMGVKSLVLEQSPTLRIAGTSLAVWTNGWRALETLGVAEGLREKSFSLTGMNFVTMEGKRLATLRFADGKSDTILQPVERKVLLETLVEPLPAGTIQYDSRVVKVSKIDRDYSQVELQNGSTIKAKFLIGCDGIGSEVGKYLGLEHPHYTGYVGIRGLATYPEGHNLQRVLTQVVGKGTRTGYLPMDSKRVYWFVVINRPMGSKITDLKAIHEEALNSVQGWPEPVLDIINNTPLDTLSRASISDRWMLPFTSSKYFRGTVTVAGDAMHPVTPNLAQGGCCALEDAVILGRLLSKVIKGKGASATNGHLKEIPEAQRIEEALSSYASNRQKRMLPLAVTAYGMGALLQIEPDLLREVRNFAMSNFANPNSFATYTQYDCGTLT